MIIEEKYLKAKKLVDEYELSNGIKTVTFQGVSWELYDKLHTEAINKRKAELKGNVL